MFFRSARKRHRRLKYCKNQYIFDVFRIARLRRRRGEGQEKRENRMLNQLQKTLKFVDFSYFFPYRETLPEKCSQNDLPGHSGTLPGSLREGEIDQLFAPGGPQGANNEFLGTPGSPQSPSRRAPGSLWKQSRRPRVAQRPPGSHFGAILPPFWTLRGIIFQGFRPHFPLFFLFS